MIKAFIWDMDGVLIESERHKINVEIAVLREYGIELTLEVAKEYLGMGLKEYVEALKERFEAELPVEEACERMEEGYTKYYDDGLFPLVPHVKEMLEWCKGEGFLIGLGTSAARRNAEAILTKRGVREFFQSSCCGDEVERAKPDPEIFLRNARELGVGAEECVVIEDSRSGMKAAKSAGMKVFARKAAHNQHLDFPDADEIVTDLLDIKGIIRKW